MCSDFFLVGVLLTLEQLSGGHADNVVPSPVKRFHVGGNSSISQDIGSTPVVGGLLSVVKSALRGVVAQLVLDL